MNKYEISLEEAIQQPQKMFTFSLIYEKSESDEHKTFTDYDIFDKLDASYPDIGKPDLLLSGSSGETQSVCSISTLGKYGAAAITAVEELLFEHQNIAKDRITLKVLDRQAYMADMKDTLEKNKGR